MVVEEPVGVVLEVVGVSLDGVLVEQIVKQKSTVAGSGAHCQDVDADADAAGCSKTAAMAPLQLSEHLQVGVPACSRERSGSNTRCVCSTPGRARLDV